MVTERSSLIWAMAQGKYDEPIRNQAKVKYLLIFLRNPPKIRPSYNSHRKVKKTIAIPVSAGPGKINPHTDLVLSILRSGTARYLTNRARARPLPQWKPFLIYHSKVQLSTHGKTSYRTVGIYFPKPYSTSFPVQTVTSIGRL